MSLSVSAAKAATAGVAPASPARGSAATHIMMTTPGGSTITSGSGLGLGLGSASTAAGASSGAGFGTTGMDPISLLDSLDAYTSSRATAAAALGAVVTSNAKAAPATTTTTATSSLLDPVEFLNRHYTNEHILQTQLPALRAAVHNRMDSLEDRISTALQRQSEISDMTRKHVQEAKLSIASLETRIRLVQAKASQSERAVLEITKDMKRLDCAKRHLQKTITTLKQLHMLVHAVEQLRLACLLKPYCDYRAAAQLVDATRLLLHHFQLYTIKVQPMRLLSLKVTAIQRELLHGLLRGFRIVGFGLVRAMEMEQGDGGRKAMAEAEAIQGTITTVENDTSKQQQEAEQTLNQVGVDTDTMPVMTPQVMADGTLLIDSLGADVRIDFIQTISHDHLIPYEKLFVPKISSNNNSNKASLKQHSFKRTEPDADEPDKPPFSLEQADRRFAWYRRTLREVSDMFPNVFPTYWNFQYSMTVYFLEMSKEHLLKLLDGPAKDKDSENATILLKALQKTILFEKEMMALLQRDFGTVFLIGSDNSNKMTPHQTPNQHTTILGDHGEELEFDESGRAVAANSAQGIRIKYERQKRDQQNKQQQQQQQQQRNTKEGKIVPAIAEDGRASVEQVPVDSLLGIASSAFDNFMAPYIALEEQSMDEQLVESIGDGAVDTRGELPVFTSSTGLFVYIKGSITRCTAMTKGQAFFLLFQAFQDSLNKYALVLLGKLPQAAATSQSTVVGGINIGSSFGKQHGQQSTKGAPIAIPKGVEVTVCHVISTCEYCADTVEALEDLIRDTIDPAFKDRIDMSTQQEYFHDVTAKSINVLVSGLMHRLQDALKTMTDINWATFDMVGEESSYVRMIQKECVPFFATVRGLVPPTYFRNFCDNFAVTFSSVYLATLIRLKRIGEMAIQQLLLDAYNLKTAMLKLPVVEVTAARTPQRPNNASGGGGGGATTTSTIAPAMYTKMVTKNFKRIETLLKLVGTPNTMLIDVFRVQWPGGSALDLQTVMNLKGLKRIEQAAMLEQIGLDPQTALRGATAGVTSEDLVAERMQEIRQRSTDAAAKVTNDLSQMRQKVDDFRKAFR